MFGWLFGGGKRHRRKKASGWNHTNAFNFAKPAKAPRRRTALDACRARNRKKDAEIEALKNRIKQLERINKAQQPMKDDGVDEGTYTYYQAGLKRILAITMKRQRLSTYTMPEIRREVDGLLGLGKPTEFKGYGKGRGK